MTREGFTLVEVLIALALFALIGAAGAMVLARTLDTREVVRTESERLGELQRLRALLRADLAQAAPRRTRGPTGRPAAQPIVGPSTSGDPLLVLARSGWSNPEEAPRPSIQRVEYRLVEDRLERRAAPYLDGARPGPAQVLLRGVRRAEVRFVTNRSEAPAYAASSDRPLPEAVRLTLTVDGIGEIDQLFLVEGA
jgi:general secretion pathway protein J